MTPARRIKGELAGSCRRPTDAREASVLAPQGAGTGLETEARLQGTSGPSLCTWVAGYLGRWVLGSLGTWVAGYLGRWVLGSLGTWVAGREPFEQIRSFGPYRSWGREMHDAGGAAVPRPADCPPMTRREPLSSAVRWLRQVPSRRSHCARRWNLAGLGAAELG
jgi:hypothetical protein